MFQVSSSPFPFPFCLVFLPALSLLLFSVFSWGLRDRPPRCDLASASGRVLCLYPLGGGSGGALGARASGFRGECVIMEHCFLIRLPADGAEGRGAGPCPGRAAPSSELILADVFLCGVLPEEDGARAGSGVSPGTRVRPASAGRRGGLILLCAGPVRRCFG